MGTQVEARTPRTCARRGTGGAGSAQEALVALVTALERALLATGCLHGEFGTADWCEVSAESGTCADSADAVCARRDDSDLRWATGRVAEVDGALADARVAFAWLAAALASAHANRLADTRAAGHPLAGLTTREVDVLRLVAAGRSNREAATALGVSERTIERHLENTYRKIAARNRADAVAYALDHHLR